MSLGRKQWSQSSHNPIGEMIRQDKLAYEFSRSLLHMVNLEICPSSLYQHLGLCSVNLSRGLEGIERDFYLLEQLQQIL